MKTKKYLWTTLLLFICLAYKVFAQPYYYYNDSGEARKFWRFNLQTNINELFYTDTVCCGSLATWDPTQTWVFTYGDMGGRDYPVFVMDVIKTSNIETSHRFPEQGAGSKVNSFTRFSWPWLRENRSVLDGIAYNPVKKVFYVTWTTDFLRSDYTKSWDSLLIFQKTLSYDASTFQVLDTLPISPAWITSISSVSGDGNYLYLENWGFQQPKSIGKYSLLSRQFVKIRNVGDIIVPKERKLIEDSKKGQFLFLFIYPGSDLAYKKYAVYDIEQDSTYALISFPSISHGHLSSDCKYVIIEETPLKSKRDRSGDDFLHPGRISVFNGVTGQPIQKLTLPPDGKILVFDNYPNMLYYYLPSEQRSINIDLSKLIPPSGCNVNLINSTGTKLTGGALQYYEGSWKDAVNNNDGTFFINTNAKTLSLRMTYEYSTQTKSNVTVGYDTIVFQTVNTQIQLQNSQSASIDTGTVQYYAGAWRNLGTTINGTAVKELLPANYSFRMTYGYASKDKQQDIGVNAIVVFQTVNAAVQLQNSQGNLILAPLGDQGSVQYYSGAWRNFGTTLNGVANKELLPNNYSFRMTYAYASKDKQQDLSTNPTVIFQTVNAAVQLQNSQGSLMPAPLGDQGTVQYYSGAWRDFGTTTNGTVNKELLSNNYSFRMTYAYASKDKQQDLSTNPTVIFQTVNAAVQLKNSQGALMPAPLGDQGTVQYYSGAWRNLGTTTNGTVSKELLPNNYSFRMTYEYVSLDKAQDLSVNSTVNFSTVLSTIRVKNTQGQLVDGALASYYSGAPNGAGWRQIGNTVNGIVTKELLPVNLSFRVKYGTQQQDKQQNLSTNNIVEFAIP